MIPCRTCGDEAVHFFTYVVDFNPDDDPYFSLAAFCFKHSDKVMPYGHEIRREEFITRQVMDS